MKKLQVEDDNKKDISIKLPNNKIEDMNDINPLKFKTLKIINSLFFVFR